MIYAILSNSIKLIQAPRRGGVGEGGLKKIVVATQDFFQDFREYASYSMRLP